MGGKISNEFSDYSPPCNFCPNMRRNAIGCNDLGNICQYHTDNKRAMYSIASKLYSDDGDYDNRNNYGHKQTFIKCYMEIKYDKEYNIYYVPFDSKNCEDIKLNEIPDEFNMKFLKSLGIKSFFKNVPCNTRHLNDIIDNNCQLFGNELILKKEALIFHLIESIEKYNKEHTYDRLQKMNIDYNVCNIDLINKKIFLKLNNDDKDPWKHIGLVNIEIIKLSLYYMKQKRYSYNIYEKRQKRGWYIMFFDG